MSVFSRALCICEAGMSPGCQDRQIIEAEYPAGFIWWTCPHCGAPRMRMAQEREVREYRRHLAEQREAQQGLGDCGT